jgi:hypothetical protein
MTTKGPTVPPHFPLSGDHYIRLAREASSAAEFASKWSYPFLAIGEIRVDSGVLEILARKVMERQPTQRIASLASLSNMPTLQPDVVGPVSKAQIDDAVREVSGVFPVVKSERNPYQDRISIGRTRTCDIVLSTRFVSKLHAHILPMPDGTWELRDAGSTNGTFKNGRRLDTDVRVPIVYGDVLRFGYIDAQFVDATRLYNLLKRR